MKYANDKYPIDGSFFVGKDGLVQMILRVRANGKVYGLVLNYPYLETGSMVEHKIKEHFKNFNEAAERLANVIQEEKL